jgi:hypothetical protein
VFSRLGGIDFELDVFLSVEVEIHPHRIALIRQG